MFYFFKKYYRYYRRKRTKKKIALAKEKKILEEIIEDAIKNADIIKDSEPRNAAFYMILKDLPSNSDALRKRIFQVWQKRKA
jgi:hypothetical protein